MIIIIIIITIISLLFIIIIIYLLLFIIIYYYFVFINAVIRFGDDDDCDDDGDHNEFYDRVLSFRTIGICMSMEVVLTICGMFTSLEHPHFALLVNFCLKVRLT